MRLDLENQLNSLIWEAYVYHTVTKERPNDLINLTPHICSFVFYRLKDFAWKHQSFYISRFSCESHKNRKELVDIASKDTGTILDELREVAYHCCCDSIDKRILELRLEGAKNIWVTLGLVKRTYLYRVKAIRTRFIAAYYKD